MVDAQEGRECSRAKAREARGDPLMESRKKKGKEG